LISKQFDSKYDELILVNEIFWDILKKLKIENHNHLQSIDYLVNIVYGILLYLQEQEIHF
jgi:hypothetical protein